MLAFTFFPPTRLLMLWGIGVQITVALFAMATLGGIMRLGEQV